MLEELSHRLATPDDLDSLRGLMAAAIGKLQRGFLDERQIAASRMIMGMDRQLILDGTYFVALRDGAIAGCGGWSRRATLFGGDHSGGRNPAMLDPVTDAARIRAMYTHPDHARRGVGRFILSLCEAQARQAGFRRVELAGTLAGEPLYHTCGYSVIERFTAGDGVPLLRMGKPLA
ncbi:GNAT family N-acetyltransferase [Lichenicoccus sp.]|uniref:GNAT family N-acetyltransferase n=1 Tax=Lichenicoccus sp. TaxID=2781899 RepID=UPI003D0D3A37